MSDLVDFVVDKLTPFAGQRGFLGSIAQSSGVSITTIRHIVDGTSGGNVDTIERIIDALGYDIVVRKRKYV